MQIIENKALLLKVREPGRITTVIPKSKVLDSGEVLVKWGLEESQVLKNLKIKNVPSPILGAYNWPGLINHSHIRRLPRLFLRYTSALSVLTKLVLARHLPLYGRRTT